MESTHFSLIDYILLGLLLSGSVAIGGWTSCRGKGKKASTEEYLLGSRNMASLPVGMSLLGGVISAISILGNPTEIYLYGTQLCLCLVGMVFGCVFSCYVMLPIFYSLKIASLTEYLMLRFNSKVLYKLGTALYILNSLLYMGVCLYAPSVAMSAVTNTSPYVFVVVAGLVCTFYTSLGGVKAVVYTDVLQTLLMLGGVTMAIVVCTIQMGGISNTWSAAVQGSRIEFFNMDPSPFIRHTFWSTTTLGVYFALRFVGLNQMCHMRFASVPRLVLAQRLHAFFVVGIWVLWGIFFFCGVIAYAAYEDCDPLTSGKIDKPDQILIYLVMDKLGHLTGIPGIFLAAMFGGVLSSVSSSGNGVACLTWECFFKDITFFREMSDASSAKVLKIICGVTGVMGLALSLVVGELGNIFHALNSVSSAFGAPLEGVFLTGILLPWVNSKGAMCGLLTSTCYNVWVLVGQYLRGTGNPPYLPLSIAGCPDSLAQHFDNSTSYSLYDLANSSSLSHLSSSSSSLYHLASSSLTNCANSSTSSITVSSAIPQDTSTSLPNILQTSAVERESSTTNNTIYDVSYCYFGVTGVLITMVISCFISLCTRPLAPGDVEDNLVSPSCKRLHEWFFRRATTTTTTSTQEQQQQSPQNT